MKNIFWKLILLLPIFWIIWWLARIWWNTAQAQDRFWWFEYVSDVWVAWVDSMDEQGQQPRLITIIKNAINRVLWILSLITLVLLLWGWFQMVTAAEDEGKFKAGTKILKQAAIGLIFIALSRFIVSMIFWIISKTAGDPEWEVPNSTTMITAPNII